MITHSMQSLRAAYYARVAPLYGDALNAKIFGVSGDERTLEAALLLARSGVLRFAADELRRDLERRVREQNPLEERYEFLPLERADLILVGPGGEARGAAVRLSFPKGLPVRMRLDVFDADERCTAMDSVWPENPFDCADALNRAAAVCRAMLLRGTRHEPAEMSVLLRGLRRPAILFGHERWPWWMRVFEREDADDFLRAQKVDSVAGAKKSARRGRVLIIGCGSLGSVAAVRLAPLVESMVLCDPERVAAENPVRQAFRVEDIGTYKVEALARQCAKLGAKASGFIREEMDDAAGARAFEELLDETTPDVVILTTGTAAEFMSAAVLRARGIRHLSARCYARARYFEILAIDGARGPCFHCLREQLNTGAAPSLTPEQRARYDPNFRPGELHAEPASVIDSGRCADVLARTACAMLLDENERPAWLRETLAQERNCLLGGNHAELDARGRWAYGIDAPGKVMTYGVEDVVGAQPGERCGVCGRVTA